MWTTPCRTNPCRTNKPLWDKPIQDKPTWRSQHSTKTCRTNLCRTNPCMTSPCGQTRIRNSRCGDKCCACPPHMGQHALEHQPGPTDTNPSTPILSPKFPLGRQLSGCHPTQSCLCYSSWGPSALQAPRFPLLQLGRKHSSVYCVASVPTSICSQPNPTDSSLCNTQSLQSQSPCGSESLNATPRAAVKPGDQNPAGLGWAPSRSPLGERPPRKDPRSEDGVGAAAGFGGSLH